MMRGRAGPRAHKLRPLVRRPHDASLGCDARRGAGLLVKAPERQLAFAGEKVLTGREMHPTVLNYYLSRHKKGVQ